MNPRNPETLCYQGFCLVGPERKGQPYALVGEQYRRPFDLSAGGAEVVFLQDDWAVACRRLVVPVQDVRIAVDPVLYPDGHGTTS